VHFQVHTRHASCSDSPTGTRNCAVAVREGNDILGINACGGPVTLIRHLEDPNTPPGKAVIVQGYHHRDHCPKYEVTNLVFTRNSAIAERPRDASCQLKYCQLPRNSAETTTSPEPSISCR